MMHKTKILLITILFMASGMVTTLTAKDWQVDYASSSIGFKVEARMMNVDGNFSRWKFDGTISDNLDVKGKIIVDISSIDTKNQKRDDHLRDPDFFEITKYPTAVFTITNVTKKSTYYLMSGTLKIRDKQVPIKFKMKKIKETDSLIQLKSLFLLDRTKYGITYNSFINPMEDKVIMRINLTLKK